MISSPRILSVMESLAILLFGVWVAYIMDREGVIFTSSAAESATILAGLTSFYGTMLGFVIAIVSFLFSSADKRDFFILRVSKSYRSHWSIFKGALYSCFLATFLSLSGLIAVWLSILHELHCVAIVAAGAWVLVRLILVVWAVKSMIDAEVRLGTQARKGISPMR